MFAVPMRTWKGGITTDIAVGRLAFRLDSDCFVALVRGRRTDEGDEVGRWAPLFPVG